MKRKCNPIRRKGKRNVFCPFYRDCLDLAVNKLWNTWDCSLCPHVSAQEPWGDTYRTAIDSSSFYEVVVSDYDLGQSELSSIGADMYQ